MKKHIDSHGLAMLLDLDACTGCFGCEAACRETHRYGYEEDWMRVIRRDPFYVDGKLRQYHLVAPVLDKCAACYDNDPEPLCVSSCSAAALVVGPLEDVVKEAAGRHVAIFTA